ncbi:DinB family protein [Mucilaginibacter aquatilis]|uniref:Damage-inducible protein DinB n=1 Tax=Mucilaginibacter aquatilis TaxID=1517760 RepID=A0A6I4I7H7_9SPHI|nr:DinB family protein [Mucilaginibacter aquatilis]MVN91130.1 damage-inducible protein DinB [Mucilaginibacter aquatilis]
MKTHFINLFNYDLHCNLQMLDLLFQSKEPERAVKLTAHILGAQQIWLSRCRTDSAAGLTVWPDLQAVQLKYIMQENHTQWIDYIKTLNTDDFEKPVAYITTKGAQYTDKLIDILTHVINHGTHHRAQVGQELKKAGINELPSTDYIFYTRQ